MSDSRGASPAGSSVDDHQERGLSRGALSWALFQGARDPYVILITIYIFSPYFANVMVGDPVRGQAMVADIGMTYGLIAAITGPLLGVAIDQSGARKPLLALMVGLMAPLTACLWFAAPDGSGLPMAGVAAILIVVGVLFAWNEVLHNALLGQAAGPHQAAHASGLALALGSACSVAMLVFVLWAFALPGHVGWSFIPPTPLFGLDVAAHEPDRIVGPLVGVFMVVASLPLFFFTRDVAATDIHPLRALRSSLREVIATVRGLKAHRDAAVFLAARMIYTDGMTALLLFGGVYAAGVMQWGVLEMLAFGICLSLCGAAGGVLAGWFDTLFGPKRAVQVEILGAVLCLTAQLGMARDRLFFVVPFDPTSPAVWNGPMFRSLPEVIYLALGCGVAVFVTGSYASSRTLMVRLAPAERAAAFFGLYALSGTVTMWLGSMLVKFSTAAFQSQRAGFIPIALLLLAGLAGTFFIRGGGPLKRRAA